MYQPSRESVHWIRRTYPRHTEESFAVWLFFEVSCSAPSPLTWCSFWFHALQQVWIKHNGLPTCGCSLPPPSAWTWYLLGAHHSLQTLLNSTLGNYALDIWHFHLPYLWEAHLPSPAVGVFLNCFLPTWTTLWCTLMGRLFRYQHAVPSYMMSRYFPIICLILTEYSLPNSMLYTKRFCLYGVNLSNAISFSQTPWVPCRAWIAIHITIPLSLKF